jgi:hypothetical protein
LTDCDSQDGAAWAAVREARRGITIAWISAAVNLLVVATALSVPFLQREIERRDVVAQRHAAKIELIRLARLTLDERSRFEFLPVVLERDHADPTGSAEYLSGLARRFERERSELREKFSRLPSDYEFDRGVAVLVGLQDTVISLADYASLLLRTNANAQLRTEGGHRYREQVNERIRNVRILVALNSDPTTGAVLAGPVRVGRCGDPGTAEICGAVPGQRQSSR